jgi:hypothetical protein
MWFIYKGYMVSSGDDGGCSEIKVDTVSDRIKRILTLPP